MIAGSFQPKSLILFVGCIKSPILNFINHSSVRMKCPLLNKLLQHFIIFVFHGDVIEKPSHGIIIRLIPIRRHLSSLGRNAHHFVKLPPRWLSNNVISPLGFKSGGYYFCYFPIDENLDLRYSGVQATSGVSTKHIQLCFIKP